MQMALASHTASMRKHAPQRRYLGGVLDFTGELNRYS